MLLSEKPLAKYLPYHARDKRISTLVNGETKNVAVDRYLLALVKPLMISFPGYTASNFSVIKTRFIEAHSTGTFKYNKINY